MTTISSCLSSGCQQVLDFTDRGGCDGTMHGSSAGNGAFRVGLVGMNEQQILSRSHLPTKEPS